MEEHAKTGETVTTVNADQDSVEKDAKTTTTSAEGFIVKMEEHAKTRETVTTVNADQDSVEKDAKTKNVSINTIFHHFHHFPPMEISVPIFVIYLNHKYQMLV